MDTRIGILEILENDARISAKDIATMLDLSEEKVKKDIDELRKEGIIKKFKTTIDWKKTKKRRVSSIIQVKVVPQERTGFSRVCKDISQDSRVKDVYIVTGEYDLMLLVEAGNIDEISEFVTEKLAPNKDVVGTYTHIVLNKFKEDGVVLFDEGAERLKVSL